MCATHAVAGCARYFGFDDRRVLAALEYVVCGLGGVCRSAAGRQTPCGTGRLIQGSAIDLVRSILSCNDQPTIKIAE